MTRKLIASLLLILWPSCLMHAQMLQSIVNSKPPAAGGATFSIVQKVGDETASTSIAITATASGNLLVACIGYVGAVTQTLTVTDNASTPNTYTLRATSISLNVGATLASQCYDVLNNTHAGGTIVTFTGLSTVFSVRTFYEVHRTSGSWAFDIGLGVPNGVGTGTNVPGPTLAMTGAPGFATTIFVVGDAITVNPASGSAWTAGSVGAGNGANSIITSSAGNQTSAVTDNNSTDVYAASGVAYK